MERHTSTCNILMEREVYRTYAEIVCESGNALTLMGEPQILYFRPIRSVPPVDCLKCPVRAARDSVEWRKHRLLDLYKRDERSLQIS